MMKLFRLLVVVAIVLIAVGFFRGWFSVSRTGDDEGSNKVKVNLTMDADKMKEDAQAVKKKSAELTDDVIGAAERSDDRPTEIVTPAE